jgi:hypothetical protein
LKQVKGASLSIGAGAIAHAMRAVEWRAARSDSAAARPLEASPEHGRCAAASEKSVLSQERQPIARGRGQFNDKGMQPWNG